jgi:hypothetical protein
MRYDFFQVPPATNHHQVRKKSGLEHGSHAFCSDARALSLEMR